MRTLIAAFTLTAALLAGRDAVAQDKADAEQTKADLADFRAYLEKNHAGKKWQAGPARLDSPELRKAYEKRRLYYVFSAPPLPPGAALPDLIKRHSFKVPSSWTARLLQTPTTIR